MEKFKILTSIIVSGKDLHLLNQPFCQLDWHESMQGKVSSYHQKEEFKADWLCYPELPLSELIICGSTARFIFDEAILFTAQHNGIGLSRDNLFMTLSIFKEQMLSVAPLPLSVVALMPKELLPKHLSYEDRKICPKLEIEEKEGNGVIKGGYDWSWVDQEFDVKIKFAFLKPKLVQPYYLY